MFLREEKAGIIKTIQQIDRKQKNMIKITNMILELHSN